MIYYKLQIHIFAALMTAKKRQTGTVSTLFSFFCFLLFVKKFNTSCERGYVVQRRRQQQQPTLKFRKLPPLWCSINVFALFNQMVALNWRFLAESYSRWVNLFSPPPLLFKNWISSSNFWNNSVLLLLAECCLVRERIGVKLVNHTTLSFINEFSLQGHHVNSDLNIYLKVFCSYNKGYWCYLLLYNLTKKKTRYRFDFRKWGRQWKEAELYVLFHETLTRFSLIQGTLLRVVGDEETFITFFYLILLYCRFLVINLLQSSSWLTITVLVIWSRVMTLRQMSLREMDILLLIISIRLRSAIFLTPKTRQKIRFN